MKIRNFAIVCLVALLAVYCGMTLLTSAYTAVSPRDRVLLDVTLSTKNPTNRPCPISLGEAINDPRPH